MKRSKQLGKSLSQQKIKSQRINKSLFLNNKIKIKVLELQNQIKDEKVKNNKRMNKKL